MKILEILTKKRKIGNLGERLAVKHLKKNGYKILKRNYVAVGNEIDIIAENKTTVAFIEVKTRSIASKSLIEPRPASAVTPEKQRKIIKTAKYFLGSYEKTKHVSLDIIEVYLNEDKTLNKITHIENAFNINTAHSKTR
jgi:putative endonuclease